jgi:hypothetical protein
VVLAQDPATPDGPSTTDACSTLTNAAAIAGNIALVDRGDCFFVDKARNAQNAGAIGMVVVNHLGNFVEPMGGSDPNIFIPLVMIGQNHGVQIKNELGETPTVTLEARGSDLDNMVIIHEYGHGVSVRLAGGPSNAECLLPPAHQSHGMGEGWGDFWALALTAMASDTGELPRALGAYAKGFPGFRNFLYSTDLAVNPQTFRSITSTNRPHGVGEIWALALWELYWILVEELGFDPDLYSGSGGNNIALQLVMDALQLQPCNPTFLDGRDALLLADLASYGGGHACRIWRAFAKRGMGVDADDGGTALTLNVSENFEVSPECRPCADANGDGGVDENDVDLIRNHLAIPGTLTPQQEAACTEHALSGSCDILEVALLRRGLDGLTPSFGEGCAASGS